MSITANVRRGPIRADSGPLGPGLMTTEEAAEFLNLSERQLRAWRMRGRGGGPAFIRIGRCIRYLPSDVISFMRERRRAAPRAYGQAPRDRK
jgi:Helix-turn-helix domain